jgi:hypothetical protein
MRVPDEPIQVTGAVRVARALVFHHRDAGEQRPEAPERPGAVVDLLPLGGELADERVIEAQRLLGEADLGAHLHRAWAPAPEVALEAGVPDDPFCAH